MDVKRFFLYAILVAALALAGCSSNGNGGMATGTPGGGNEPMLTMPDDDTPCGNGFLFGNNCMDPNAPTIDDVTPRNTGISTAIVDPDPERMEVSLVTDIAPTTGIIPIATRRTDALHNPMRPGKSNTDVHDTNDAPLYNMLDAMPGTIGDGLPSIMMGTDDLGVVADEDDANEWMPVPMSGDMTGDGMDMMNDMMDPFTRNDYRRTFPAAGTTPAGTDMITVYDNREAGEPVTYDEYYTDYAYTTDQAEQRRPGINTISGGVLTFSNNVQFTDYTDLFEADDEDDFPSSPNGILTLVYDTDEKRTFTGMFNGVSGTFSCTPLPVGDLPCAARSTNGVLSFYNLQNEYAGTWRFTPDAGQGDTVIPGIMQQDNDYLAFGFWVRQTGTGDDATYGISTFSDGSMPFDNDMMTGNSNTAIAALMGTATYSGMAAGQFAMLTDFAGDSKGNVATGNGEFMADVSLTARFGSATDDFDDFTISGMVDNFMDANGDMIDEDWSLQLDRAEFALRRTVVDTTTGAVTTTIDDDTERHFFSGATTGMEGGTMGKWTAMFYGPTVAATATAAERAAGYPTGVAGEFIGYFQNGHVLGAFGAEKME